MRMLQSDGRDQCWAAYGRVELRAVRPAGDRLPRRQGAGVRKGAAAVSPDKKPGKERAPGPPLRGALGAHTSVGTTLMRSPTSSTIAKPSAGPMLAGRRPWHARHFGRRSCHEPCHASSKRHHSVRISAAPDSAPGGIRTHTKRILSPLPLPVGLRGPRRSGYGLRGVTGMSAAGTRHAHRPPGRGRAGPRSGRSRAGRRGPRRRRSR